MKKLVVIYILILLITFSCTTQKKLTYLYNLPETAEPQHFPYEIPLYRVQYKDILYVDIKMLNTEGKIENILSGANVYGQTYMQGEANQYLAGYPVDKEGNIQLPVFGKINVSGKTLPEIRQMIQSKVDSVYRYAYTDVKLLSFRFTVLGEARNPGSFSNYNDYLTVFEAIGRAGGVGDYGRRDRVLVVRTTPEGTVTYRVNLQDKNLLTSPAYFLMPNDVLIVEPEKHKIFNMNLPTISFVITTVSSAITTTLLLINYFKK